jgi:hypothetical protein
MAKAQLEAISDKTSITIEGITQYDSKQNT